MWATAMRILGYAAQGALGWVVSDVFNTREKTKQETGAPITPGEYLKRGVNWTAVIIAGLVSIGIGYFLTKKRRS